MSASFEQSRVITGRPILHDDLIDGRKVTRAEPSARCDHRGVDITVERGCRASP
jgi:hypothetical protein